MNLNFLTLIWHTLIQQPLITSLSFFSSYFGLGLGIIILTLIIKLLLLPLTLTSLRHSQQIASLQDKINKLKKKYKNQPQKLAQAQAKLFKQHGVIPAAGCLPMLVQVVLFFALYQILLQQVGQNGFQTGFLWLDLTKPDPLFILPLLAGIFQLGAVLLTPTPTSNNQTQQMQKQMMIFMSVFTVFIASRFPSGIVLYWVVNSAASLVQQFIIKQKYNPNHKT